MQTYYKNIDRSALLAIYKFEWEQLSNFKNEFDGACFDISKAHGWNYNVYISRKMDKACRLTRKPFDGYTSALQVDFTDNDGNLIELENEDVLNFFENITVISFDIFKRKFKVSQEELTEIKKEIKEFIYKSATQ